MILSTFPLLFLRLTFYLPDSFLRSLLIFLFIPFRYPLLLFHDTCYHQSNTDPDEMMVSQGPNNMFRTVVPKVNPLPGYSFLVYINTGVIVRILGLYFVRGRVASEYLLWDTFVYTWGSVVLWV